MPERTASSSGTGWIGVAFLMFGGFALLMSASHHKREQLEEALSEAQTKLSYYESRQDPGVPEYDSSNQTAFRLTTDTAYYAAYAVLTDKDGDGKWDVLEKVMIGHSLGAFVRETFYKKGFGFADPERKAYVVDENFFTPYQD